MCRVDRGLGKVGWGWGGVGGGGGGGAITRNIAKWVVLTASMSCFISKSEASK